MAEFKSFDPKVEVLGEVIEAFKEGFPLEMRDVGEATLAGHGILNPQPGEFYPLQSLLDAMKTISDKFGGSMLFRVGEQIALNAVLPPGLDSVESALGAIDQAYHMNHRGGDIGHYVYSDLGSDGGLRKGKMVCPNPYPCAFDRGVIEGFARRFKPEGCIDIIVSHNDSQPCRRDGSRDCTYIITWT